MSKKQLLFDQEGRRHTTAGMDKLARAVKVTLGPGGRNVMLEKKYGTSNITKDGVTVSKAIDLPEPFENMGAKLLNEVASRTNREVGDGTTTAVVLAEALVREGNRYVMAGASPVALRAGMAKACDRAVQALEKMAVPIKDKRSVEHVGLLASNGDKELGSLFAEALHKVGKSGVVKVEENDSVETSLEFVDGMSFDKGYVSPYFATNSAEQTVEFEDPYVLITDHKITNIQDLVPVLEALTSAQKPLVIVAEDVEGEALAGLILNKLRGVINVVAVKAPGFGDRRKAMLEDLSVFTGGMFYAKDTGFDWAQIELSQLGRAKQVEVTKNEAHFLRGGGKKAALDLRLKQIEAQIEQTSSNYDREKLEERRAKICGKIAIIRVGGSTELEIKERHDRAEDALNATRAATEEGICSGSGTAYVRAASEVRKMRGSGDEQFGIDVVVKALSAPLSQLGENAGLDGPALVAEIEELGGNQGFDVVNEKFVDLHKAGIVDALKVLRVALQNAVSIASLNLVSDVLVTDSNDKSPVPGAVV